MTDRESGRQKASAFFEGLWQRGDFWELESSQFEQAKYARQFSLLDGRRYHRALEIGCGAGCFTKQLASLASQVVALDVAPAAIARALRVHPGLCNVDFRVANVIENDFESDDPWDLIVMSETICYLGWLYSFFDVAWLAGKLFDNTCPGGRFLMANTYGRAEDYILRPWIIDTYRDLFLNVGYQIERQERFQGIKNGVDLDVLISLLVKPMPQPHIGQQARLT